MVAGPGGKPTTGHRRQWRWDHVHLCVLVLAVAALETVLLAALLAWFVSLRIPDISSLAAYRPPQASLIYDRHGREIDRVGDEYRVVVRLADMPPLLPRAFIAAEDARFYEHPGVDALSVLRALFHNLQRGRRSQGGSTITQQVTRGLLLTPEKTFLRKFKEAVLAYRLDRLLTKDEILEIYLNQIYLGEGAYGVEAAARTYFGKSVGQLTLGEMALLAGLPQAPSRYSPRNHPQAARNRQTYVLNRMAAEGYITATMAQRAHAEEMRLVEPKATSPAYGYFLQEIRKYVQDRYGVDALTRGGLRIHTTLDPFVQQTAALAADQGVAAWRRRHPKSKKTPQVALVALSVADGAVLALTGGRDFLTSQFNRAVQARRQPGSAFKPLVYAVALSRGMTPATTVTDEPITLPGAGPGRYWRPRNFDGRFDGPMPLREALIHSKNVVSVKVLQQVGIDPVVRLARQCGITSELRPDFSLALGSSGVSLLELTGAYAAFARGGVHLRPWLVARITTPGGRVLERHRGRGRRVLDPRVAYQLTDLLSKVIGQGTGRAAKLDFTAAAGKTGTTDDYRDAWFIGYTPDLAAGVWLGFDRPASLGKKETGGRAAAPVWRWFMERLQPKLRRTAFVAPPGITLLPVAGQPGEWDVFLTETVGGNGG